MTLVVVDDYPLEGRTIEFLLKRERPGITYCGQALSGEEGKELILRLHPDIAIVDVKMPGTDGLQLTQELKQLSPQTRVIILSAFGDFAFVQSAIRLGACDYLLKPMSPEELYQAIDRAAPAPAPAAEGGPSSTLDIPEELINAVRAGLAPDSAAHFLTFWKSNTEDRDCSFQQSKLLSRFFLPKLLELVGGPGAPDGELLREEGEYLCHHFSTQIPACLDMRALQDILLQYVQSLADVRNHRCHETGTEQVERAKAIIEQNISGKISLKMVSDEIFISPFYLSNLFKKRTGTNFIDYVIGRRIERSKQLLITTNDTIEEVAAKVGYDESNYFRRLFKKTVGVSPREFRRQNMTRDP